MSWRKRDVFVKLCRPSPKVVEQITVPPTAPLAKPVVTVPPPAPAAPPTATPPPKVTAIEAIDEEMLAIQRKNNFAQTFRGNDG